MTSFVLRDYQDLQVRYATDFIFNNKTNRTSLLGAPTGVGKSVIIGGIVKQIKFYWPQSRILMLTHVKELVEQNYEKAQDMSEDHHIGLWSAGLRKKEWHSDIVFAGIDTVVRNPENLGHRDVVLIDEAHRVSPKPNTNYNVVLNHLQAVNPYIKGVGLTATLYRMGQGWLTNPWTDRKINVTYPPFWENILCDLTSTDEFNKFFTLGYLKRLVPKPTDAEIDVSSLRVKSNEEYSQDEVAKLVNNEEKIRAIVDEICEHGIDRRSWLVFAAGNVNATLIYDEMNKRGISCAVVTEKTSAADRKRIVEQYKRYEIRCLINNDIFTTGFDHNGVDLIAVVRVTNSTPLWVQMLGRGTRPVYAEGFDLETMEGRLNAIFASGVYNCLVLDFAGNSKRLGTINNPVIPVPPEARKKKGAAIIAAVLCPVVHGGCGSYVAPSVRQCDVCGFIFPMSELIREIAASDELIDEKAHVPDIRKVTVNSTSYVKKQYGFGTNGGTSTSVIARYNTSSGKFEETLMFIGDSSPVGTRKWWERFGSGEIPANNDIFLANYTTLLNKQLCALEVYMNKPRKSKPEIIYYGFSDGTTYSN